MKTSFQDDFDREVERQAREARTLRCNDRDRANGTSEFFTCLECFTGPCKLSTTTQITPATDREIADMAAGSSNHSQGNNYPAICVDKLIARLKVERDANEVWEARMQSVLETNSAIREQTILECELIARNLGRDIVADSIEALLFPKDGGK